MQLDVHHLRVLRAIADAGSLSRAAVALGITQPAVHAQLNRLERMLGYQLFERGQDGVLPTAMGEMLLRRVTAVLPQMDQLLADIQQRTCATRPPATARVAAVCSAIVPSLPSVVTAVWPEITEVTVVNDEDSERVVSLVDEKRVELALVKDYPGRELAVPGHLDSAVVVVEPTVVLLPDGHPLTEKDELVLTDLRDQPLVLPSRRSSAVFRDYFIRACADAGFVPSIPHQANSESAIMMVVSSGALGLAQPCRDDYPGVRTRVLSGGVLLRRHVLLWHRDTFVADRTGDLLSAVVEAYWERAGRFERYRRHLGFPDETGVPD